MVQRYIVARLREPDAVSLLSGAASVDVRKLHQEAEGIRLQVAEADDDRSDGVIDRPRWLRITSRLNARLKDVEQALGATTRGNILSGLAGSPDIERIWYGDAETKGLSVSRRAAVVREIVTVTLLPARRGRKQGGGYFDPSSVSIEWRADD
jgi:hypothetical protein